MEWLVILLSGGAGTYAVWRVRELRAALQEGARELERARRVAEEDVTVFGEQLQCLDRAEANRELDQSARDAYQLALDAYERASRDVSRLHHFDGASGLVETLGGGRHALACARAAMAGEPPPAFRVPCFFNPQHGPSVTDVVWTPPRRGTRTLPACHQCAARVRGRERPEIRMVRTGYRRVPYWEAGSETLPSNYGYFTAVQPTGPRISWICDTAIAGDWDLGHYGDWSRRGRR